jgi:hypothetical protein
MNLHKTVKSTLAAVLAFFTLPATQAANPSSPAFVEVGKAYLITLPATTDKDSNQIVEIVSAAGEGWFRVISYPTRDAAATSPKASPLPTEKWINFAQVVTATEAITHNPAK